MPPNHDLKGRAGGSGSVLLPDLASGHEGGVPRLVTETHHRHGPEATSTSLSVPTQGQASPDLSSNQLRPRLHPHRAGSLVCPQPPADWLGLLPHTPQGKWPPPAARARTLRARGRPSTARQAVLSVLPFSSVGLFQFGGRFGLAGCREEASTGPARVLEICTCLGPRTLTGGLLAASRRPRPSQAYAEGAPCSPNQKAHHGRQSPLAWQQEVEQSGFCGASSTSACALEWASMQARPPVQPGRRRQPADGRSRGGGNEAMCPSPLLPHAGRSVFPSFPYLQRPTLIPQDRPRGRHVDGAGAEGNPRGRAGGQEAPTRGSGAEALQPVPLRCATELPDLGPRWWRGPWASGTQWSGDRGPEPSRSSPAHSPPPRPAVPAKPRDSSLDRRLQSLNGDFPNI